jgi:2-dehydropantoate 2-reductase
LKAGLCVRRVRFVMFAPDPRQHRRCQAGKPLIDLSEFPEPPLFTIGEWNGTVSPRALAFQAAARQAGLDVDLSDSIHAVVWAKFIVMAAFSAITSLTRLPVRTCATVPALRELVVDAMREAMAVARAQGVLVDQDLPERTLAFVQTVDPGWKTSMCNDLEAGRRIEIETISGDLHALGGELGIATPVHTLAFRALRHFAAPRGQEPGPEASVPRGAAAG